MELKVLFFRYKMLCDKTWPNWVGMPKEGLKELLKVIPGFLLEAGPRVPAPVYFEQSARLLKVQN